MKSLIVEDDLTSRVLMNEILRAYGVVDVVTNGKESVEAVRAAIEKHSPYDLICLDIMMPEMDGKQALNMIRSLETSKGTASGHGAKIVMTTAVSDIKSIYEAFENLADGYVVKPIDKAKLQEQLKKLKLL